jgi:hypothetical protein
LFTTTRRFNVADTVASSSRFVSISTTLRAFESCKRSKARSTASGVGWM